MAKTDSDQYLKRIAELEAEVADREKDLAKFREELVKANVKLESLISQLHQELRSAQSIQKSLVPTEFPNIPGFEFSTKFVPSRISGGDYFDIFEHEDRFRFGVVLASSSGHAMSALFLSVLLKFTGQLEARKGAEANKILAMMVKDLVPGIPGDAFADIFYGVIDRRSFELSYCLAGEVILLHQSYPTGEVKKLEGQAGSVNKDFTTELKSKVFSLNPRDRLILCTRGVTDCKNLDGEDYGLVRLTKAILEGPKSGVHELRNHILYEVQKHGAGQEPVRDRTVLVLEVKDRVIKLAKN